MILMVWSSERAQEYAVSIEQAVQEPVQTASSLHEACERLRSNEFSAVIVDQWVTEAEPEPTGVLFDHLGSAVPVFVNFGISGVERILRELRAALSRRGREMVLARHAARQALRDELKDDVTALLLLCDVALHETSGAAAERLVKIKEIAKQVKTKLVISDHLPVAGRQ
jgi:CheY-like chemotaxis protein